MAIISSKRSELGEKVKAYHEKLKKNIIVALVFLAAAIVGGVIIPFLAVPCFLGFFVCLILCKVTYDQGRIYESGFRGESESEELIARSLPNDYYGIPNVRVQYDGKESELDMVVVGKTGVFIVETKNHGGTIWGSYGEHQWTQMKVGRGGTPYSKEFYSPIKQVKTHIYRLAHFLRQNGVQVHVDAMVVFANPDTVVNMEGMQGEIPVYANDGYGATQIREFITGHEVVLTDAMVDKIRTMLEKL